MGSGGRVRCVCAAPHNSNVNTNSKGLILDHMTCSATHFNVPMVTADFLTALLKAPWQVWHTNTPAHTHRHTHTSSLTHTQKGDTQLISFSLTLTPPSKQAHTNKSTLTQPKEQTPKGLYGVVLILVHVKISAQSPLLPLMYYYSQHWSPHCAGIPGWRGGAVALPSTRQKQNWGAERGGWTIEGIGVAGNWETRVFLEFLNDQGGDVGWFSLLFPQAQMLRWAVSSSRRKASNLLCSFLFLLLLLSHLFFSEISHSSYLCLWSLSVNITSFHVSWLLFFCVLLFSFSPQVCPPRSLIFFSRPISLILLLFLLSVHQSATVSYLYILSLPLSLLFISFTGGTNIQIPNHPALTKRLRESQGLPSESFSLCPCSA